MITIRVTDGVCILCYSCDLNSTESSQIAVGYHLNGASLYLPRMSLWAMMKGRRCFSVYCHLQFHPNQLGTLSQETRRPKIKCQLDLKKRKKDAHRSQLESDTYIHPNINDSSRAFSHPPPPSSTLFMTTPLSCLFKQKSPFHTPFKQSQRLLLFFLSFPFWDEQRRSSCVVKALLILA